MEISSESYQVSDNQSGNIPHWSVRIIKVKWLHQNLVLAKKLCKLTVNILFPLQLRALEW